MAASQRYVALLQHRSLSRARVARSARPAVIHGRGLVDQRALQSAAAEAALRALHIWRRLHAAECQHRGKDRERALIVIRQSRQEGSRGKKSELLSRWEGRCQISDFRSVPTGCPRMKVDEPGSQRAHM